MLGVEIEIKTSIDWVCAAPATAFGVSCGSSTGKFRRPMPSTVRTGRRNFGRSSLKYNVAVATAESAQILGQAYESYLQTSGTVQCETEFRYLSKKFLHKDCSISALTSSRISPPFTGAILCISSGKSCWNSTVGTAATLPMERSRERLEKRY